MKPNAIQYLSLARKAGRIEYGEQTVGGVARAQRARLIILAADAPGNTVRRARGYVAGTGQQLITVPFTKEEIGNALGKAVVAMATFTDPALALAFVKALEEPEKYADVLADLQKRTKRVRQRQQEEKAHERNVRMGKTHHREPEKPAEQPVEKPEPELVERKRKVREEQDRQPEYKERNSGYEGRPQGRKPGYGGKPDYRKNGYEGKPNYRKNGYEGKPNYRKNGYEGKSEDRKPGYEGKPDYRKPGYGGKPDYRKPGYGGKSEDRKPGYGGKPDYRKSGYEGKPGHDGKSGYGKNYRGKPGFGKPTAGNPGNRRKMYGGAK